MNYNFTADEKTEMNDLVNVLEEAKESDVKILFKKNANLYNKSLNLKILQKLASERSKTVTFDVENQSHKDYIDAINGDFMESADDSVDLNMEESRKGVTKEWFLTGLFKRREPEDSFDGSLGKSFNKKRFKFFVYLFGIFLLFTTGGFALWWYLPSATVKVTIDSQILVKILDVKADPAASEVAVQSATIPAINIDATVTESQTILTTGKREVGDNAKGKVTFYNKTNDSISIKKGAIIKLISTDKESLRYEVQEKIDVPAQTEKPDGSGTEYGSKDVNIKAVSFGEKYNQDSEEKFEVDGYNTDKLIAENKEKIEGGTLKELNVVTQADIDGLKRSLDEFIRSKVVEALNKKVVVGQTLSESSIEFTTISGIYDKKVDEEGEDLTLTMTTKGVGIVYDQKDLDELISELIKTVVPLEYSLDGEKPEYEVAATKAKSGTGVVDLQIKLRSYITPNIDQKKIINDMTGMRLEQAQSYLNAISNIKGYEISLSPKMPPFLQVMPHISKNIEIIIDKK